MFTYIKDLFHTRRHNSIDVNTHTKRERRERYREDIKHTQ